MPSAISALFFLSGFTGLLYEVLWAKYLSISLGSTAVAQTSVLALFMGGLALGNAILGPKSDAADNPLKLYARLELGIAAMGLASIFLLRLIGSISSPPIQLIACAAILLPPTILMGGTLPALSRLAARETSEVQGAVAWFYFINSAGAVLGTMAAGFYLIAAWGVDISVGLAALINAGIGLYAARMKKPLRSAPAPRQSESAENSPLPVLLGVVFLSGFVSLGYEIAWTRLLALVLGSSTYSFSLMLAAFIAGIALGSWYVARGRLPKLGAYALLGWAELGLAVSILVTLPLYDKLPWIALILDRLIPRTPAFFQVYEASQLLLCFALTLAPTIFLGMTLPLASRAAARSKERIGRDVGLVFSVNTAGNVLGAAAAGLWLLPALGLQGLIRAGVLVNLAAAAAVLWSSRSVKSSAALALASLLFLATSSPLDRTILSNGPFRSTIKLKGLPSVGWNFLRQAVHRSGNLIYYKDGREATVSVFEREGMVWLKVNGKTDASSARDMGTQILQAHLPFMANPDAKRVLMIGLGGGVTAGSILTHPIESLDVAELSPAVVEGSRFFSKVNGEPLKDPRLRLHIEDGKSFLRKSAQRYDFILSVPSNPWIAGIASLFSAEFYRDARAHLGPKGVMAQWFHLYEMSDDTLRMIFRTFASEFPDATLWQTQSTDLLLLGSNEAQVPDFPRIAEEFSRPAVVRDLERIGIKRLPTLLSLQMGRASMIRAIGGDGPMNRDLHPLLEYEAPKAFYLGKTSLLPYDQDERADPSASRFLALESYLALRKKPLSAEEYGDLLAFHEVSGLSYMLRWLSEWLGRMPADPTARLFLAQAQKEAGDDDSALATLEPLLAVHLATAPALSLGADLARTPERKMALLARLAQAKGADLAEAYGRLARLHETEDYEKAVDYLGKAAAWASARGDKERADALWMEAAIAAIKRYDTALAMRCARAALGCDPNDKAARDMISGLLKVEEKYGIVGP